MENVGVGRRSPLAKSTPIFEASRISKKKTKMTRQQLPAWCRLVHIVRHTFTQPATFLTNGVEHWTYPEAEKGPELVKGDTTDMKAHAQLPLATMVTTMVPSSEIQLVTPKTENHTEVVLCLIEDSWSEAGLFEVVGYEAESYRGKVIYNNYAFINCQVLWDRSFHVRQVGNFEKGGTHITKKMLMSSAQLLVKLLDTEIEHS